MKQTAIFLDYLNEYPLSDTFSKIILFIFENKAQIPTMTISELADASYVTPPTITRFCRQFGFRSYFELKDVIEAENRTDPTRLFRLSKEEFSHIATEPMLSFESYGNRIVESIKDTLATVDIAMIDRFLQLIDTHQKIVIFGYSTSHRSARSLQEGLLLAEKLTFVANNDDLQMQLAQSLDKNSLAIIISSYGNFFSNRSAIFDQILTSHCKTILLTQQQNNFISASIDHIFCINSQSFEKIGSYSTNFFIDFMCRRYFDLKWKKK